MHNDMIHKLAAQNADMSDIERLVNLYWSLSSVLTSDVRGDVVEIGCNAGKTSVFLRMIMDYYAPERALHVYDSLEGLPVPGQEDVEPDTGSSYLKHGECAATEQDIHDTFAKWSVKPPVIHPGWFQDTLSTELPDAVSCAYLDEDFYESIVVSLENLYPKLTDGAIVVIDDYCDGERNELAWDRLPGPKKVCDEFFDDKLESVSVLVGSNGLGFGCFRKGFSPPLDVMWGT